MEESLKNETFERRAQSVVQAVILALMLWVGYSVIGLREGQIALNVQSQQTMRENADLRVEIASLKREISDLKTQIVAATIAAVAGKRQDK